MTYTLQSIINLIFSITCFWHRFSEVYRQKATLEKHKEINMVGYVYNLNFTETSFLAKVFPQNIFKVQKQPPRVVLSKRYSVNMQQIYTRTITPEV